jgi:flagellum-specific ATP synthase
LVERAGNGCEGGGSITAFYTVLVEGEYNADPIADAARAILDGHIVLSREIAEGGIYPAIDIEASISRAMHSITDDKHRKLAQTFRQLYASYRQNRDLISVGAYQKGSDPAIDLAIQFQPKLRQFISQSMGERVDSAASLAQLAQLLTPPKPPAQAQQQGMPQAGVTS